MWSVRLFISSECTHEEDHQYRCQPGQHDLDDAAERSRRTNPSFGEERPESAAGCVVVPHHASLVRPSMPAKMTPTAVIDPPTMMSTPPATVDRNRVPIAI